jgi:hypothetical protein
MRDYQSVVDGEWLKLTDKGRAVRNHEQLDEPKRRLDSSRPLVFVSCGQAAENEIALGRRLVDLIEQYTNCEAYFAEYEHTLEGLARNIIGALHRMTGMVFVMHRRGEVTTPHRKFQRGSVWVEQEIAIAASLQQQGRSIAVAGFVEQGIDREGLRELLHLNPTTFHNEAEVVAHFEELLQRGEFTAAVPAKTASQEPTPILSAEARMVGPDESRKLGLSESNATRLLVTVTNAGRGPAQDVVVSFEGLLEPIADDLIGPIGPGGVANRTYYCPRLSPGSAPPGSVPEVIRVRYDGFGWSRGSAVVQRVANSHPPIWKVMKGAAPVAN